MEKSLFVPKQRLTRFMSGAAMNRQYGIQLYCLGDVDRLQALVPPPLKVISLPLPGEKPQGIIYIYIVNIREPSFAPWYMEGGIGVMCDFNGKNGLHFIGLQLSGPGALMGMCSGRESSGLPKKICERIRVERTGDAGRCFIERDGVRILDVECDIGQYNDPMAKELFRAQESCSPGHPVDTDGKSLLFRHHLNGGFDALDIVYYDSPTLFHSWEPMSGKVTLASTINDPWGEIPLDRVVGGGWMVSDNRVNSCKTIYSYPAHDVYDAMQYLFTGRYDQCMLEKEHQIYE
ncbi:MAG: acetoacetate decarboxylase family protein [Clostridia bacterium]|nr:acetoacetate decarboxylase family protein [Clostridia bacterium]